ncbi:DUF1330 domain-containing protein [Microbulbifer okhotskensis]|nr:DUF1330 domain-containing protein [Microbulbifer okhotskensis]
MVVGLDVGNDNIYQAYRDAMMPILKSYGGSFGYDFKVSEVLRSETVSKINRIFTIRFLSKEVMSRFFSDSEYLNTSDSFRGRNR